MKKILFWGILVFVIVYINLLILKKEETITNGCTMLLRLAPVDPRSLIQGDYMRLRYAIAREIPQDQLKNKGFIVVSLDKNNVAKFVRIHKDESLQADERLLFYRNRGQDKLWLCAESFMFQEGDAKLYSKAQYGELKVDASGTSVLVGLRGEDLSPLGKTNAVLSGKM